MFKVTTEVEQLKSTKNLVKNRLFHFLIEIFLSFLPILHSYLHSYLKLFTLLLNLHNLHNLHCYFHYPMLELGASTLVLDHCFYPAWHGLDQIDQDLTGNGIPFFQDKIE